MMTGGFLHTGRTLSTQFVFLKILAISHGRQAQGQCLLSYTLRSREEAGPGKPAPTQDLDHLLITNKVSQSHGIALVDDSPLLKNPQKFLKHLLWSARSVHQQDSMGLPLDQ